MKKTVLFLMNGFGVEQSDSYNIYSSQLMPNLDGYIKRYLFSTIECSNYNYVDGYRFFSTGNKYPLTYMLLQNHMEHFENDTNMQFYINNVAANSKIQLFMFLENEKNLEQLKYLLKYIKSKKSNPIFLHIVLTSADMNDYKDLDRMISKITYDYNDCTVATVIGKNVLFGNDLVSYMNMLKTGVGETWKDAARKFDSLVNNKVAPFDAKEFYMNEGFKIEDTDSYFIFNFVASALTDCIKTSLLSSRLK